MRSCFFCWRRRAGGYGSCKADDQKSESHRRKSVAVENDAKSRRDYRRPEYKEVRTRQMDDGERDGRDPEQSVLKKKNDNAPDGTARGGSTDLAFERDRRSLEQHVAEIERVTECGATDGDQKVGGTRRGKE